MSAEDFYRCAEVSPECPIQATVLGYDPSFAANLFFLVVFAACGLIAFTLGVYKRTYAFAAAVTTGCVLEVAGYAGRVMMAKNPWSADGFKLQICCIILGPALLSASIYLTLKHIALAAGAQVSRLQPALYTWIFISGDVFCLILQGVGGGVAAAFAKTPSLQNIGNRLIIAGVALQVSVLSIFASLSLDLFRRLRRYHRDKRASNEEQVVWSSQKFRVFVVAVAGAFLGIYVRCVYRIVELARGWANPIMRDEPSFIALEGLMILISAILLSVFPPGYLFPQMQTHHKSSTTAERTAQLDRELGLPQSAFFFKKLHRSDH